MTNTVEEIALYCIEENTFGALLLTGEWGSGKTYLLEHDLPRRLGNACALLRVSLFGETSVEMVRQKIKKTYFNKILEGLGDDAEIEPANAWIRTGGTLSGVEKIFAQNPSEYIRLESTIFGRTVVLIFDDLERCHLSQAEILGCINEYCENLHMKTIIVANEEKIQTNNSKNREEGRKDFLAYSEIKEKIIARTVRLSADYDTIITNIIGGYRTRTPGYVEFLQSARPAVTALMNDSEIRNIRSLRCGFQDFENIFLLCRGEGLDDAETRKYFTAFLLFVLLSKGGRISKSAGFGYNLNRLPQKYPSHYSDRYMPTCVKDWVHAGAAWDPAETLEAIRRNTELLDKNAKPQNHLRSMTLLEMDDVTVERGWDAYLDLAYSGMLTLGEYVLLLRNLTAGREYRYTWPSEPDLDRLDAGIDQAFRYLCQSDHASVQLRERLDEATLKKCTAGEWQLYSKIVRFVDSKAYLYGLNRNRILEALKSRSERALFDCRSYDTDRLDAELAAAVVECYHDLDDNQRRMTFIDTMMNILRSIVSRRAEDDAETPANLRALRDRIRELRLQESQRPLRTITTDHFLAQLEQLL